MNEHFKNLFALVEEVRQNLEEMERLQEVSRTVAGEARKFYNSVIEKYRQEEKRIIDRMEQAEKENKDNKAEIVELTRQQLKAEATGGTFPGIPRLEKLKSEVATYPLKLEAMEKLKADVYITAADQRKIQEYRAAWFEAWQDLNRIESKMMALLGTIKGDGTLFCLASLEHTPAESHFMDEAIEKLQQFRREDIEE